MGGRLVDVFTGSPERSVVELLLAWWGIECGPPPSDPPHPPLLHQVWDADAHRSAWGHQDVLLSRSSVKAWDDGNLQFFIENQDCWQVAYTPGQQPNPQVVVSLPFAEDGPKVVPSGIRLHEFLARTLVLEAVFGSAWWASGTLVEGADLSPWRLWSQLIVDPEWFVMPALYSDGNTLCFVFESSDSAFYGAASLDELASSEFTKLGTWFAPDETMGPVFAWGRPHHRPPGFGNAPLTPDGS